MILVGLQSPKKGAIVVDPLARKSTIVPDHPWQMNVIFKDGAWRLTIDPGFINGIDPRIPRAEQEALAKSKEAGGTSKPVYNNSGKLISGNEIGIMDANPVEIKNIDWKDILVDYKGLIPDPIPKYFHDLYGIKRPPSVSDAAVMNDITNNTNNVINQYNNYTEPTRVLYKTDVWIEQTRTTFKVNVDIPGNLVTGQLVDYSVGIDSSALKSGARPIVGFGPMIPTRTRTAKLGQLNPAYIDSEGNEIGMDFVQIGTIYWLSPDINTSETKVKDPNDVDKNKNPTWTFFVRHELFYNLSYYKKNVIPFNLQQLGLNPFLAFFVGQYTFAGAASFGAMEAAQQQLINSISQQVDQSGMFWTT